MAARSTGQHGFALEELLRAYFLRSGFFVIRGVPFQLDGEVLTDIDLWIYEHPTGTSRRKQIVDAKSKNKPKAIERLLWTKGLAEALDMDGAYIATTDSRKSLRSIARRLGISLLDGADLQRIRESQKVLIPERLSDEELNIAIKRVDYSHRNRQYYFNFADVKSSVVGLFGEVSVVRGLDALSFFANTALRSHAQSEAAILAARLAYFSAAVAAISLDFVSIQAPFRTIEERRTMFVNAIRYGSTDKESSLEKLRLATGLIRKYVSNGTGIAMSVEQCLQRDLEAIPAEIVADQAVRMSKEGGLFSSARELEKACFLRECPSFDMLDTPSKSLLGSFFDFCGIDRVRFAMLCKPEDISATPGASDHDVQTQSGKPGPLFER